MTKRVCLVGPVYPYRGGIAHYTSVLAQTFAVDHDVLVVSFSRLYPSFLFPGKTQYDESGEPLDVPSERIIDSLNPFSFWRAARAIRAFAPDVIVFQWWQPFFAVAYSAIVSFLGGALRRRVVFLCHNVLPHERSFIDVLLIRLGFTWIGRFLVQSKEDGDNLRSIKKGAVVRVHPHPIYDTFSKGVYTRRSAREKIDVSGRVVMFFGLVRPYKGLGVLLDAFAETVERLEARLLVVGEFYGSKAPYLSQIARLGIGSHVRIVDHYVPNEAVEAYFLACDVVVLPYLSATQSGITQIAFGFDKPVIVTHVGGLPDVVDDGVTGYVVPPNEPKPLAEAIVTFFDKEMAAPMAKAIRDTKGRFSWQRCREILIEMVD